MIISHGRADARFRPDGPRKIIGELTEKNHQFLIELRLKKGFRSNEQALNWILERFREKY